MTNKDKIHRRKNILKTFTAKCQILSIYTSIIGLGFLFNCSAHAGVKYIDMNNPVVQPTEQPLTTIDVLNVQATTSKPFVQTKLDTIIDYNARKYDIPPALLKAIIKQESNFNTLAVSSKGARGLMQMMLSTAADYGSYDLYLPQHNIEVGSRHLSRLLKKYNTLPVALAAYNAGEGSVDKYGGIPPFLETRNYVLKVLRYYNAGLDKQVYEMRAQDKTSSSAPTIDNKIVLAEIESDDKGSRVLYFSIN